MKYLVLLLVLVVAFGFWKSRRNLAQPSRPPTQPPPSRHGGVCALGLHLPRTDAIVQYGAHYCCADHLRAGPSHR